ncbi:MAG: uracil-DNA glycosylase [Ectothiorhodospiraceae bacterium]|nr:uracil-DNA glycosylase [Ectothiorhodospiraceae bacterium]
MPDGQLRHRYLQAMGIPLWELRRGHRARAEVPAPGQADGAGAEDSGAIRPPTTPALDQPEQWRRLREAVAGCTRCGLCAGRTQTVFGVGSEQAQLLIVGEAPGAEEDRRGEPFVGRAGQLLDRMLKAIDLDREQVFIANILKCRPPNNRDPLGDEVEACMPYLREQMRLLQPRVILCVGRVAARNLLQVERPLRDLRGARYQLEVGGASVPVVVSYHPAYLLRSPADKGKAWSDLKRVRRILKGQPV